MPEHVLLRLELRSPIIYLAGNGANSAEPDFFPEAPANEGDEALYLFGEGLLSMGADGPRCAAILPRPLSAWERRGGAEDAHRKGEEGFALAAGDWLFSQWRPKDRGELAEGIEWFAREVWWERRRTVGHPLLRLVREDGKVAFQLLWRLEPEVQRGKDTP